VIESEDVSKYTVIWKVYTGEKFSVNISGNFLEEISGLITLAERRLKIKHALFEKS